MPRQQSQGGLNSHGLTLEKIHRGDVPEGFPEELKPFLPKMAESLNNWIKDESFQERLQKAITDNKPFPNAAAVVLPIRQRDGTIQYKYGEARSRQGNPRRIDAEILAIGNALEQIPLHKETSEQFLARLERDSLFRTIDKREPAVMASLMNFCTMSDNMTERRPCDIVVPPLLGNVGWFFRNVNFGPPNNDLAGRLLMQSELYEKQTAWQQYLGNKIDRITEDSAGWLVDSFQETQARDKDRREPQSGTTQVDQRMDARSTNVEQPRRERSSGDEESHDRQDSKRRKI